MEFVASSDVGIRGQVGNLSTNGRFEGSVCPVVTSGEGYFGKSGSGKVVPCVVVLLTDCSCVFFGFIGYDDSSWNLKECEAVEFWQRNDETCRGTLRALPSGLGNKVILE